jgi:signal transduction histidine kinase
MLADVLERTREQVAEELEHRAAVTESTELPLAGRRRRLHDFVEEVIGALRRGGAEESAAPMTSASGDGVLELRERELVRRYLIEQVEHNQLDASPSETAIVSEWAGTAERAHLREQNQRLRVLLDDVADSAALFGPDGRILYCNLPAFQSLRTALGVPRGQIVGRTPAELGVPAELVIGRPIKDLLPLARGHESFEATAWGREKEGRFGAVYGPDGTISAVALVVRDIHSRKLADTRLDLLTKLSALAGMMEYEEVAEALVQVPIPEFADWCAVTFVEGRRIRRTFLAHRDPSKAPLRDAILRDLPTWDRHPLWQGMLTSGFQLLAEVSDDLMRRLATTERQYRLLQQLGIRSLMVVPLVARGQLTGIITFAYTADSGRRYGRDDPPVAEEVALHAAHAFENTRLMKDLKAGETRFRIALAGARTGVYEQDTALRYVWYYNPLLPGDLLGKTDEQILPADEAELLMKAKQRVLEEGESLHDELDLSFGGAERRHFRETIEPLRDHTGKIVGVIGATTDITDQQRVQRQLTEELAFRERMMGIIGHDLRSPLHTVVMVADLLLRTPTMTAAGREHLLRLRRASGRMQEMIDTLLDFTRARFMGNVPIARVPSELGEIARVLIDELRIVWPDHAIGLDVQGDTRGEWDPARMTQTISNLVTNAISFGDSGGTVQISVTADGDAVTMKVHNHGPPIAPELLPVLFEPFRRGAPDRSPRGLGLGLYIVQQIVHGHDGTIDVESSADGTTFTLSLPRHAAAPASPYPPPCK